MFSKLSSTISHIISKPAKITGPKPIERSIKDDPKADKITRDELGSSYLQVMFEMIHDADGDELAIKRIERFYGKDCRKLITAHQAAKFIDEWLDAECLSLNENSFNLLTENRRNPFSTSAMKRGFARGNRHKYGHLPYVRGRKAMYYESVLRRWLEENVKPTAEPVIKVAS